jgi:hypothetical protein
VPVAPDHINLNNVLHGRRVHLVNDNMGKNWYCMHVGVCNVRRKELVLPTAGAAVIATWQQQQQHRHHARHQPAAVPHPGPPA